MKFSKLLKTAVSCVICLGMLSACSSAPNSGDESDINSGSDSNSSVSQEAEPLYPDEVKITALKGPTAIGMTKMMSDEATADRAYSRSYTISAAVDEISPMIIQGTADIACVPANLASVLYNKTDGGVEVLAVNTLGVLYIVDNGAGVTSLDDLKGKTIFASGKGATPEYALNYLLSQNGIDPETDVTIEWKSEHSECLASLVSTENSVAMLPQPFVTTALTKNEGITVAIDLTEEWDKLDNGSALLTGVVIARKEFIEQYPAVIDEFLNDYARSVDYVNTNVADAAQLCESFDIIPAAAAEKAIPECNIVCITGAQMKEKLSGYLNVLYEQLEASVGGALPGDDFYFGA